MQKLLSIFIILFLSFGLVVQDANAKRFGGGRSFGMQRSVSSFSRTAPVASPLQQAAAGKKWLGPLAGLVAGGLIGSLLMGNGFASGILSWLAIAGVVLLLVNLFKRKTAFNAHSANNHQYHEQAAPNNNAYSSTNNMQSFAGSAPVYPAGFNATDFLRESKSQFIRLQAAYDQKNLNDIRKFTAPEVFAEIQLQLQERGDKLNQTDVLELDAVMLDVSGEYQDTVASVRFTGKIREEDNQPAPFNEVWHFQKDVISSSWIVAGIQQH